jgi:hypothetical protein
MLEAEGGDGRPNQSSNHRLVPSAYSGTCRQFIKHGRSQQLHVGILEMVGSQSSGVLPRRSQRAVCNATIRRYNRSGQKFSERAFALTVAASKVDDAAGWQLDADVIQNPRSFVISES